MKNSLILDPNKQVQEATFFRKIKETFYLPLDFNYNVVKHILLQKHLSVYLDGRLGFCEHLENIFKQVNKIIGL